MTTDDKNISEEALEKYNQKSVTTHANTEKDNNIVNQANSFSDDDENIVKKANEIGIAYLERAPKNIPDEVLKFIASDVSSRYKIIAFGKNNDLIKVAAVNPLELNVLNALRFISEEKKIGIEEYLVSEKVFSEMFQSYTSASKIADEAFRSVQQKESTLDQLDQEENPAKRKTEEVLKDAPVAKLVEVIISHAIEGKASDIHIEPMFNDYRIRFRVDGILHLSLVLPKEIGPAVISRIKILSNLKIEEKRKPQDGRFKINYNNKKIDFRVSTLPVIEGEKVVMRILDKEEGLTRVESLGLMGLALENLEKATQETYGMILLTGPTGSGKSTTSYAMLKILNQEERNIVTLEDPIEYYINGLNQSQIKPEIGYTFANGLRTILRQDPNVILVGEIRDSETAELAVHAALTGHLLFSTLHTNTAVGAIPRLVDMGIEPFLLSSALRLVVAQRLVRRICEKCKAERKISTVIKSKIMSLIKNVSA